MTYNYFAALVAALAATGLGAIIGMALAL